jgi:hypothetical protein
MSTDAWTIRKLRVVLKLSNNVKYNGNNGNVLTLEGYRVRVHTRFGGGDFGMSSEIEIFGLGQDYMNDLTMLAWKALAIEHNVVEVYAQVGDAWPLIYAGDIIEGIADYREAPEVPFRIYAVTAGFPALASYVSLSYNGTVTAQQVITDAAAVLGLTVVNHGVNLSYRDSYFSGSAPEVIRRAISGHAVETFVNGTQLHIVPRGSPISNDIAVELNADTGLVGYPTINRQGIAAKAIFLPNLLNGTQVRISGSPITAVNNVWRVFAVYHSLESELPGGDWFTEIMASDIIDGQPRGGLGGPFGV